MGKLVWRNETAKGKAGKNKVARAKEGWWWCDVTLVLVLVAVSVTGCELDVVGIHDDDVEVERRRKEKRIGEDRRSDLGY